jgi:hypothetical protein
MLKTYDVSEAGSASVIRSNNKRKKDPTHFGPLEIANLDHLLMLMLIGS